MTKSQLKHTYIPLCVFIISIFSIIGYIELKTGLPVANTSFWSVAQVVTLLIFYKCKRRFFDEKEAKTLIFVKLYLLWNLIMFTRGFFVAENYWDWKYLFLNGFALMLPVVAYMSTNKIIIHRVLFFYLKWLLPLFIIFYLVIAKDSYGFYLVPVGFVALFWPFLNKQWKCIVLIVSLLVIFSDLSARSNAIKFTVPFIFILIYYLKKYLSTKFLELLRKLFFCIPVILFFLAITQIFNIFNMDEYIKGNYVVNSSNVGAGNEGEDLKADTRSFIYIEVLQSAKKNNFWIFGRTPARGNDSISFGDGDMSGRGERNSNEVAILNVFVWTGLVGVILFSLVFYHASYFAVNYSNNIVSKYLGLYLSFRWVYSWVEDVNNFSLTTTFLWILIGFCYSKTFRMMTDNEIKIWVREIFDNLYSQKIKNNMATFISNRVKN